MTRTQYYTATSIDGFIADADNSLGWLFTLRQTEASKQEYPDFIADVGALAMGSTTYEWILDHERLLDSPGGAGRTSSRRGCSAAGSCQRCPGPTSGS